MRRAAESGWSLLMQTLVYRPVGFGDHHWELFGARGVRWFVTVCDLRARRVVTGEPLAAGYGRLRASLTAAQALRALRATGCDVVVAPLPANDEETWSILTELVPGLPRATLGTA